NQFHNKLVTIPLPAQTAIFADAMGPLFHDWDDCTWQFPQGYTRVWYANYDAWGPGGGTNYENYKQYTRHGDGSVLSYVDGHAGYIPNRRMSIEKIGGSVCPSPGKRETPIIAPYHQPY